MPRRDTTCAGPLECYHGGKALDVDAFELLVELSALRTVDEGAERIGPEPRQSTGPSSA